jgi:acyl-CoA synthetase (NDP forming)
LKDKQIKVYTQNSVQIKTQDFAHALFYADSIAVIGASNTRGSWGFMVFQQLLNSAKTKPDRKIWPVNPSIPDVLGEKTFPSILEIPSNVELAVIVVSATRVPEVLSQCTKKAVKAAIIISAGFAEIGKGGVQLQNEIVSIAQQGGLRFVGPNCIGHASVHEQLLTAAFARWFKPGSVAFLAQSGNIGSRTARIAMQHNIGFCKFVGTGNEADLHTEDFLEYLSLDEDTRLIAAYIEGLKEGRRFLRLAKEITIKKPIVLMKAGGTRRSAQAAMSHTGALVGSEAVYRGLFKQTGVIRVDNEDEMCDVIEALQAQPLPRGNKVGILTIGGGPGVVTAEICEKQGIEIASLQSTTVEKINSILPPRWSHGNPVDMVGIKPMADNETILNCLEALFLDSYVDTILSLVIPIEFSIGILGDVSPDKLRELQSQYDNSINMLNDLAKKHNKPIYFVGKVPLPEGEKPLLASQKKIPSYPSALRAARVVRHLVWYQKYKERKNSEFRIQESE